MRELISTILHPTVEGIIFVPMILSADLLSIPFAILPGRIAEAIWMLIDDVRDALSDEIYRAIRRTPNFWSGEWIDDLFR